MSIKARVLNLYPASFSGTLVRWGCLALGWVWLHRLALGWLLASFQHASELNQILIVMVGIGLGYTLWRSLKSQPQLRPFSLKLRQLPLFLMMGSAGLSVVLRLYVQSEALDVLCFGIGTYGWLGLVIRPHQWRQGVPIGLLIAGVLPFSIQFGSGLGFPARMLTAQAVEQILTLAGVGAISSHDIILLETGIAHVDLPCSGLKSLWTGVLFFLGCTLLEQRRIGWRWLVVAGLSLWVLILTNVNRVLLLVMTGYQLKLPEIAELLHVPLGILGFLGACALIWWLLQWVPTTTQPATPDQVEPVSLSSQVQWGLVVSLLLLGSLPTPAPLMATAADLELQWPGVVHLDPLPLTPFEQNFFSQSEAGYAEKYQFNWNTLSGSILVVASQTWKFHHAPELCFIANGLSVSDMEQAIVSSDIPVRWLALEDHTLSALYWFQSATLTTDNLVTRIWDDFTRQDQTWLMVSILLDQAHTPTEPAIQTFVSLLHNALVPSLET